MNVLIYMTGGFDRHGPSNHLFSTLIEDLLRNGDKVILVERISGGSLNPLPDSIAKYDDFYYKKVFVPVSKKKNQFIKRYLLSVRYAYKSRKALKSIFNNYLIDVVLIQSNPTPFFQIKSIRKYYKGKIVFNIQDLFPGSSIATGKMKNVLLQKFFYWLSRKAYQMIDYFTVISDDSKRLLSLQGVELEKIEVIVNWYNSEEVQEIPWESNRFVQKYNLKKGPFYIQYAGGMGYVFDYKAIIFVAKELKDYNDIVFLMIGDGSQKQDFVNESQKLDLKNIAFFPMQPQDMVSDVYSACDIQIIPLNKKVIGNSVPSKVALLMSCKRLIINSVDPDSDYYDMFNRLRIGVSVSNNDHEKLSSTILNFFENRELIQPITDSARAFGVKNYSREVATKKYINLFMKITDSE